MSTAPCITVSSSSRSSLGSPAATPAAIPTVSSTNQLSQLSRNASVISTSSSSSASSVATTPPTRPRPLRQFSYQPPSRPRSPSVPPERTRPHSPTTPRAARAPPPVWVPRELGRADSDEDSDSALPELATTSRRGSDARARAHSRRGSANTVRRPDLSEPRTHSRSDSASSTGRPVLAPPASPKNPTNLLAGSPKLGSRPLVMPGKRSRVPSTASSAAVLAGELEAVARDVLAPATHVHTSSNLNPNSSPAPASRHAAPSPTPPATGLRKRRTHSTSTTGAKARSRSTSAAPRQRQPVSAADFEFGPELGSGSYSTVVKAWFKGNANGSNGAGVMGGLAGIGGGATGADGKVFAVKVSDKQYLINKGKVKYANVEKTALALLGTGNQHHGHPGIVKLHWTFHDPMSLYFVLDLVPNGELLDRIKRLGSLTSEGAKYYTAQIVDAVGWMHGMGVVHRDLKPENILLDEEFRVKITDFGSARVENKEGEANGASEVPDQRASSFVGTAEYVSPELLIHNVTSRCSDVWAIGCILFQMLAGRPPFKGGSEYLTLEQVKRLEYVVPEGFDSSAAELVGQILVLEPAERPKMDAIREHPFLVETLWEELWTSPAPPMESGPVMGPPPPESPMEFDSDEEDIGETWDRMVGGDEEGEGYPGAEGYQAGMAYSGVRAYGMGGYGGVGADGVGYNGTGSGEDGVTPRAAQGANYMFQDYKFGGEVSTVPIPTSGEVAPDESVGEEVPASTLGALVGLPVVAGPLHTEPGPIERRSRSSIPTSLPVILSPGLPDADNEIAVEDDDLVPELQNMTDQRARMDPLRASHSSTVSGAGTTSSSEGSPLGSAIGTARTGSGERMPVVGGEVEGLRIALAVMGLGGDSERLSAALAPGERPVFMSSILSRPRHRLTAVLPSKRRILVLTDTPRLLCVKEQRDRVVVKSELTFSGSPNVKAPSTPGSINGRGRSLARWKSSTSSVPAASTNATPTVEGELDLDPVTSQTIRSVEVKGEKSFIVQTVSKVYTFVADNSEEAVRWVQQIKAAQQMKRRRSSVLSTRPAVAQ